LCLQALSLRKNGKCPYGLILPTCLRSDPLHVVMERLANSGTIFILFFPLSKCCYIYKTISISSTKDFPYLSKNNDI